MQFLGRMVTETFEGMRTDGSIFGTKEGKDKAFRRMELPKLAQLTKITGQLLQTKVYLFWQQSSV